MRAPVSSSLSPLPPFPVFSFRNAAAGGGFDLEAKLLPVFPRVDFTKVFYERTHGRWRPRFNLREKMRVAIREKREELRMRSRGRPRKR